MRKGEATRARILDEATRQAAQRGLGAVSLADVGAAIGLSKSGLFKHFESKEAMQVAVIDRIGERFADYVWRPAAERPPGRARLEAVFERWLAWAEDEWALSGCPMVALSTELDDQPGAPRDELHRNLERWRRALVREMKALRTPPLSEAEAQLGYFQMKSYVLGHSDARRMLGDADARAMAQAAFAGLIDRLAAGPVISPASSGT